MNPDERFAFIRLCDVVLLIAEEVINRDNYMQDFSAIDKLKDAVANL